MKIRSFAALLLSILLLMMQVVTAQATLVDDAPTQIDKFSNLEETYTYGTESIPSDDAPVQIDKFTGEEIAEGSDVGGSRVLVNDTVVYDKEKRAFVYYADKEDVFCNVASGMITTDSVWLTASFDSLPYHLYKNGELLENVDYYNISEPGAYTFTGDEVSKQSEILHFTIVAPVTGRLSRFQVPEGFVISTALLNGMQIPSARTYVDMNDEGDYDIAYRCPKTEEVYLFRVAVDHTPPVLALAAVDEEGVAKGPVDISDLEEGAEIGVWLNDRLISYKPVLTQSGRYRIVLKDAAGNMTEYSFMIRVYYNANSIIFFAAVLAIGIGIGIYALYSRRHMRIR